MTAVVILGEDAYGISIHRKVRELSAPRSISLGAIYITLDRMEDKGYLRSWLSDPTPERGGRSKRRYELKSPGEKALREALEMSQRISAAFLEARSIGPKATEDVG